MIEELEQKLKKALIIVQDLKNEHEKPALKPQRTRKSKYFWLHEILKNLEIGESCRIDQINNKPSVIQTAISKYGMKANKAYKTYAFGHSVLVTRIK